jgi:murein DD-endopeptidase MepM/ murein hydrolase activator NlpD
LKIILSIFIALGLSFASTLQEKIWWKGESLLTFFDKHQIPNNVYFNLSKTDKELSSEIYAGVMYQIMTDTKHKVEQVLIPISEEMQIHIFKDENKKYVLDIIPIEFNEIRQSITIPIKNSPYQDILDTTGNKALANEFIIAFKKSVNFKRLRKDDLVSIVFTQKIRSGKYFGTPEILAASVQIRKKFYYIFLNQDDKRYYNDQAKSLTSFLLRMPLQYTRISSKFTLKRYHPILKKYRAHLGVDFAAPIGRKVYATANGKIIHKGSKGGYGKTIMIRHENGLKSLYAHLNSYNHKIKVGQYVQQGDYIGRVGTTGRSTGPHLHFGLYKNGRAINPLKTISVTKTKLIGKKKRDFVKVIQNLKKELQESQNNKILKIENFKLSYKI